jgi:hypothetical protein
MGCGKKADRDILGRCINCFRSGVVAKGGSYFRASAENPYNPKLTKAHDADIGDRRWNPTEKRMFYLSKEPTKSYFFEKR